MGLGIYILDLRGDAMNSFTDDESDSIRGVCESAPEDSLRHGVNRYGETLFNSIQLNRLVAELKALPEGEQSPVVQKVVEGANQAIYRTGYIRFIGD
ncbi:hypothetical protein DWB77_00404 [Streptomyces hundungensis]|uniref:Uncharacterized protein n=1 Tax=Streptomyces hundungensis TaxID=1077946 RepID=A0A387HC08_9ACTN|nr:hypothetical protein DWB77_00404 [Streptomyces hundungensis]